MTYIGKVNTSRCTYKNFVETFQASHAHLNDVDRAMLGASVSG